MKKGIAILLLVCLMPLCALAEMDEDGDVVVTLNGAEFFFTPIVGYCVTRQSALGAFLRGGLDRQQTLALMEAHDVYALLCDEAGTCEIQVFASEGIDTDFDEMTDHGAEMMRSNLAYAYQDQGYDVVWAEIYAAPDGHTFVRMLMTWTAEDGTEEQALTYFTGKAGYMVGINLRANGTSITDEQLEIAELLADSFWITPIN